MIIHRNWNISDQPKSTDLIRISQETSKITKQMERLNQNNLGPMGKQAELIQQIAQVWKEAFIADDDDDDDSNEIKTADDDDERKCGVGGDKCMDDAKMAASE